MKKENKTPINIPDCPRCGQKTYMIRRESILEVDPNKEPWMCAKCTQERLLIIGSEGELADELAHLEGKIPSFRFNGDILQIDPRTRTYRVIGKYKTGTDKIRNRKKFGKNKTT